MQIQCQVCTVSVKISVIGFLDQYKDREVPEIPVNKMVDSNCQKNDKKAREATGPIVDTVKLCGRQNILLQGILSQG